MNNKLCPYLRIKSRQSGGLFCSIILDKETHCYFSRWCSTDCCAKMLDIYKNGGCTIKNNYKNKK